MGLDIGPIGISVNVIPIGDRKSCGSQAGETHSLAADEVQVCIGNRKGEDVRIQTSVVRHIYRNLYYHVLSHVEAFNGDQHDASRTNNNTKC